MKARARILVVDNNLADQEMIREMLPVHGLAAVDVDAAMEGGEAIAMLRDGIVGRSDRVPDLVLLDLHLSRVHGREVLSYIRHDPALLHVPVIMFTTAAGEDARRDCMNLGADDFLIKPRTLAGFSEVALSIKHLLDAGRSKGAMPAGGRP